MVDFQKYRRSQIAELRPYNPGEVLVGVSISQVDVANGSPQRGDMIARNPKNHEDQWLVAAQYFKDNFEPIGAEALSRTGAVKVKALEWEETHSRRSDEDPTIEWNGGFEADSALGYYEISMGVGSDAYYWAVTNPLGDNVGSDFEDPSYAKAAAQQDYERRILSALEPAAPEGRQGVCATEGCDNHATNQFIRGGVGSTYCGDCFVKVIEACETTSPAEQAVTSAETAALTTGAPAPSTRENYHGPERSTSDRQARRRDD